MEITITVAELIRRGLLNRFVDMRNINPYARKEGQLEDDIKFTLTDREAYDLGLSTIEPEDEIENDYPSPDWRTVQAHAITNRGVAEMIDRRKELLEKADVNSFQTVVDTDEFQAVMAEANELDTYLAYLLSCLSEYRETGAIGDFCSRQ